MGLEGQFKEGLQAAEHRTHSQGKAAGTCSFSVGVNLCSPWGSPTTSSIPAAWNWEGNPVEDPPRHLGFVFTAGSPEADGTEGWATLACTPRSFCSSLVGTSVRNSLSDGFLPSSHFNQQLALIQASSHLQRAGPSSGEDQGQLQSHPVTPSVREQSLPL